jgi:DNA-binding response OmpR family regulator
MGSAAVPALSTPHDLMVVVVDTEAEAARYAGLLRSSYRVAATSQVDVAKQFLHRSTPSLVLAELAIDGQSGVEVCREAKSLPTPPAVLVTTPNPDQVPDALAAGCDGVLLKPFPPNLLFARIARLLRGRGELLRAKAEQEHLKAAHLRDRSDSLLAGTNRVWPTTHCPYCNHAGATSFEFASYRRAWYACLECKKVWIAKRQA